MLHTQYFSFLTQTVCASFNLKTYNYLQKYLGGLNWFIMLLLCFCFSLYLIFCNINLQTFFTNNFKSELHTVKYVVYFIFLIKKKAKNNSTIVNFQQKHNCS